MDDLKRADSARYAAFSSRRLICACASSGSHRSPIVVPGQVAPQPSKDASVETVISIGDVCNGWPLKFWMLGDVYQRSSSKLDGEGAVFINRDGCWMSAML